MIIESFVYFDLSATELHHKEPILISFYIIDDYTNTPYIASYAVLRFIL